MQISLSSDNYSIVSSGQAFLFGADKDLKINILEDNGNESAIVLEFKQDASGEQRIEQDIKDDTLTLNCFNFNDAGTGLTVPVNIGEIDGHKVFLMFWSSVEGKNGKVRSVKYTLFMGDHLGESVDEK
jgi:hypothetical protein